MGWVLFEYVSGVELVENTWPIDENGFFEWQGRIVIPETQAFAWQTSSGIGTADMDVYLGGYTLQAA